MAVLSDTIRFYQRLHGSGRCEVDFLELIRRVEAVTGERLVGKSVAGHTEPVRFGQVPHLNYASTAVAEIVEREKLHILVNFFGLWGANGPMPLEASSYVHNRSHNCYDQTLRRFADIVHHRFIGLYYRAWKANEQGVGFDKPTGGLIAKVCDSLSGSACQGTSLPGFTSSAFGMLFGNAVKSRDGLETILNEVFHLPIRVVEKMPSVMSIPFDCRGRLGTHGVSELGRNIQLGSSVRTCTRKFRVRTEPIVFARAAQLFPGLKGGRVLMELIQSYLDRPLEWDLELRLETSSLPSPYLSGVCQLGRSVWLGRPRGRETGLAIGMSRLAEARHARR